MSRAYPRADIPTPTRWTKPTSSAAWTKGGYWKRSVPIYSLTISSILTSTPPGNSLPRCTFLSASRQKISFPPPPGHLLSASRWYCIIKPVAISSFVKKIGFFAFSVLLFSFFRYINNKCVFSA